MKTRGLLARNPAVAILGARQVGKTDLARTVARAFKPFAYFDLETREDAALFETPDRGRAHQAAGALPILRIAFGRRRCRMQESSALGLRHPPGYTRVMRIDAAVIGGGVVGAACAFALARAGHETVLLEQHRALGTETTSRSSEVIHAGLYYPRGSLKAETCVRGAELLYAWCKERSVPFARVGKLVVAVTALEIERLVALAALAKGNGASVEMIDAERIRTLEPNVRAVAALLSPNTGIVDSHALVASLAAAITAHRGTMARGRQVIAVESKADSWALVCDGVAGRETIEASFVVNAAGLYADVVAAMFGWTVTQRFVKGSYFRLKSPIVRRLVYPIPPGDGSLGIHATVDLAGAVRIGPDAELATSRTDYGLDESRRGSFHAAAVRYLPALREEELVADTCGIRPKVEGGDFVIEQRGRVVHLVGIESPGLTASLAIAERVSRLFS